MPATLLVKTARLVQRFFYLFLDISGILLGVFLTGLGGWILAGRGVSKAVGGLVLFLGIAAFLIHLGHYYSWKLTRWIFGKDDYFHARKKE